MGSSCRRFHGLCVAIALLCVGSGCSTTAIDFTFTTVPEISDVDQLLSELGEVEIRVMALDRNRPLYPASFTSLGTNPRVEDVNGDGTVDVLATATMEPDLAELPIIRLEQGGMANVPMRIEVRGMSRDTGEVFAAGDLDQVDFREGEIQDNAIVLNILPEFRAPRVAFVWPNGTAQTLNPQREPAVIATFSKQMDEGTLNAAAISFVRIEADGSETPQPSPFIYVQAFGNATNHRPAYVHYALSEPLTDASYRFVIPTTATDVRGRPLDQDPLTPGNQPFVHEFTVNTLGQACGQACVDRWCTNSGPEEVCPAGFLCSPQRKICLVNNCDKMVCMPGFVCVPSVGDSGAVCTADCRLAQGRLSACFSVCGQDPLVDKCDCGPDNICECNQQDGICIEEPPAP